MLTLQLLNDKMTLKSCCTYQYSLLKETIDLCLGEPFKVKFIPISFLAIQQNLEFSTQVYNDMVCAIE